MISADNFQPGNLVRARGREWVVLPEDREGVLHLRPLGGADEDASYIYLPLEENAPASAIFPPPDYKKPGNRASALLLRDALRLKLRSGAGPFRSFGNLAVEPRAYQLVPLIMALKHEVVRLLIADDVGIGKTIEAGLIIRELLDRGEINRATVVCPPHLCEQWVQELESKFNIQAEVVRTATASRLERGLPAGRSIFEEYPFTIVSLDYIKSDRRRDEFLRSCPEFVVVEEAHTCVHSNRGTRHQRYQLLKGLASNEKRHMVFLTATPHSGDDETFHNLLGLLKPEFEQLLYLPEGAERKKVREDLALYFVQRRRADIEEWRDSTVFPERETAESSYKLTGAWGYLFDEILGYAHAMVVKAEGKSKLQQRLSFWAALALLRCAASSPASASMALRTRLAAADKPTEVEQLADLEGRASESVMDGAFDEMFSLDEAVPPGTIRESEEDRLALQDLIQRAEELRGPKKDPKLAVLIKNIKSLVKEGFCPVVFCRYIATAHYVAEELAKALPAKNNHVLAITGELNPDQRQEKIEALAAEQDRIPVLVATDCLSEGINLQNYFNAICHYDLSWNPTRHEQREGRVDRFGQASPKVRALMLYGKDNPVDGAVLKVILRKAESIRRQLGVSVPMPSDNRQVSQAIMQTALLGKGTMDPGRQKGLFDEQKQSPLDAAWESAQLKASQTRTVFAQRRLKPADVLPEWEKAVSVLGGARDVTRFVHNAVQRLEAPLGKDKAHFLLHIDHLPLALRERLAAMSADKNPRISFKHPAPTGVEYIHRSHALVACLADYIAELALAQEDPELAARCGALASADVRQRTTIFLLRLRSQLTFKRLNEDQKILLCEECLGVAVKGVDEPRVLKEAQALELLEAEPCRNMSAGEQTYEIKDSLDMLPSLEDTFAHIAQKRAEELLADHRRVRDAAQARGTYQVEACLPVDVIGCYVLIPGNRAS